VIDHVSIPVCDLEASTRFYEAVLREIGYVRLTTRAATVGFGKRYPEFWLNHRPAMTALAAESGAHVCLRAKSRAAVDGFHAIALQHGATSAGAPRLRPYYAAGYYAAFILDRDGNKIEAVTFVTP
jgi:catechol 2,3-dioxygenase-like lactoylglutathione lyase family enzyme